MASKENKRKCFKCGCSPAENNVKLFRFPKPAIRNNLRCALWAKYIFPEKSYASTELQTKLHNEHRMLCQNHFKDADFTDNSKKKLLRTAVPYNAEHELPCNSETPQAGPSYLKDVTNISNICVQNISVTAPSSHHLVTVDNVIFDTQTIGKQNKTERERILYDKCTRYMKKVYQLRNRIKNLKNKMVLNIIHDDTSIKKLSKKITPAFALLLQGQLRNFRKKYTGRRWTKEEKITALRIYKRSPTCYRLLRRMFNLPSPSTLKTLLNKVPFGVGINQPVFEVLKEYVKTLKPSDNEYILMFDEMSLKKHLNYNIKEDVIEGFQDHASQGRSPLIAAYALVFMIGGIRQRLKQPIAHYFSSGFSTADRLAVLIKEVLYHCNIAGIKIAAIVCDMDGVNRRALNILGASLDHPYITVNEKEIVTFFDPPHLLKCFRNLFMKYVIECTTDISSDNKVGKGIAKWSHIKDFYEIDNNNPNFVYAPVLKRDHLNPNTKQKMKVKLAAQILSHSVAGGMFARISGGELTAEAAVTANVVSNMDKLFDCNSDSSDLRRGKPHATNLTNKSLHLKHFQEMKRFFSNMKYINSPRTPPSKEGWIWTINGIERLWRNLVRDHNIRSLATRRLQQDPLENLFGCIRGNCGSNTNPTTGQFVAGLKTAILTNLSHIGTTGNCETDNNVIIHNFDTLLSSSSQVLPQPELILWPEPEFLATNDFQSEINKSLNEDSAEIQACAYVCGFIFKNISTHCVECKAAFISENIETHHTFVECREYSQFKKSLNYVTKDMVACVECCASIVNNFLKENGHMTNLKVNIVDKLKKNVNFDFLDKCGIHKEENVVKIAISVFFICIKRFCILKNRLFAEEASAAALKRKMNIILHK